MMKHGGIDVKCCHNVVSVSSRMQTFGKYGGPSSLRGSQICQNSLFFFLLCACYVEICQTLSTKLSTQFRNVLFCVILKRRNRNYASATTRREWAFLARRSRGAAVNSAIADLPLAQRLLCRNLSSFTHQTQDHITTRITYSLLFDLPCWYMEITLPYRRNGSYSVTVFFNQGTIGLVPA